VIRALCPDLCCVSTAQFDVVVAAGTTNPSNLDNNNPQKKMSK
jgi:hypothetical protein